MAQKVKTYKKADGITYKVCGGECGQELPVTMFGMALRGAKYYYERRCRACKSKYNKAVSMAAKKQTRKAVADLERQLEAVHAQLMTWERVAFVARQNPYTAWFGTPQDFILATLKTVYDHGRKTSKKELLHPEDRGEVPTASGDLPEKPLYLREPVEQKPPIPAD